MHRLRCWPYRLYFYPRTNDCHVRRGTDTFTTASKHGKGAKDWLISKEVLLSGILTWSI